VSGIRQGFDEVLLHALGSWLLTV